MGTFAFKSLHNESIWTGVPNECVHGQNIAALHVNSIRGLHALILVSEEKSV
jgi:hypothetical protein